MMLHVVSTYNQKGFPAFDPQNQYIGEHTPLDTRIMKQNNYL